MFDLDLPWWEYIARALLIYCALLLMMRFSGKRTIGQFTPFDLLVVMLLSESVSPGLTGGDNSTTAGLIVALTLILLNLLIAFITARSRKAADLVEGRPVLLGRDGQVFDDALRRNNVPRSDVEQALREEDCELEKNALPVPGSGRQDHRPAALMEEQVDQHQYDSGNAQ